ncbi:MAG TPA: hypothetical protein VKE92_00645, partial [Anaerolineales bacterium]|nr:hypothetical protein [Anaerolineales bacterium]
ENCSLKRLNDLSPIYREDHAMTPWVHRVSYPSTVLDIFLTLLIAAGAIGGIAMLLLGILLFV